MCRLLLVLILLLALAAGGPDGATAATPKCSTSGKTLIASSQVRVFRFSGGTYACWVRGRRIRSMGTGGDPAKTVGSAQLAVAGRWVAWSSIDCGFDDDRCVFTVRVLDARTGRKTRSILPNAAGTESLVLDGRGVAAWIERDNATTRVVTLSRSRVRRVLDESPEIKPSSLALVGSRIYWLRAATPQTASLP